MPTVVHGDTLCLDRKFTTLLWMQFVCVCLVHGQFNKLLSSFKTHVHHGIYNIDT